MEPFHAIALLGEIKARGGPPEGVLQHAHVGDPALAKG
jgi:hypothetical protein